MRKMSQHRRITLSEYWLLGLGGVGIITQALLIFLASKLPQIALYNIQVVNLLSYCGLLTLLVHAISRRHFSVRTQSIGASNNSRHHISHASGFPPSSGWPGQLASLTSSSFQPSTPSVSLSINTSLQQLKRAIETMQLGVTITDMQGCIIYTNPAEARMHGYNVEELLGKDLGILAPTELRNPMTVEEIDRIRHLRESINIRKDGSRFPVRLMSDVLRDQQGTPVAVVTTCEDITEQKRLEHAMKQRTRELTLLNRMSDLLQACHDEHDTYQVVGRICQKLFPQDSGCLCIMDPTEPHLKVVEFWGTPPDHSHVPSQAESSDADHENHVVTLCPYQNVCAEQDCLCAPISVSGEILGLLSLCFRADIGENSEDPYHHYPKAKQTILSRIAEHYALSLINLRLRETLRMESIRDPLTGLFNRRYMEESLEREARRAKRHDTSIGIIMLDIDHFKPLNDVYGHDAGDVVLQELGLFLQRNTRGEDIACRYGGEEFLLIMPEAPVDNVIQRAKDLHAGIRNLKIIYHGQSLQVTVSVGVATLPHHSTNVREVVKAADLAMYQAKRSGRDHVMVAC